MTRSTNYNHPLDVMPNWKKYSDHIDHIFPKSNNEFDIIRGDFSRLKARYSLASNFTSINALGYSQKTLNAYSSGFSIMLVDNCFDHFFESVSHDECGKLFKRPVIEDDYLAGRLRLQLGIMSNNFNDLREHLRAKNLEKFQNFLDGKENDLMIVLISIRIMMAHGSFTSTSTNTNSKKNIKNLMELKNLALTHFGIIFNEWLDCKINRLNNTKPVELIL